MQMTSEPAGLGRRARRVPACRRRPKSTKNGQVARSQGTEFGPCACL